MDIYTFAFGSLFALFLLAIPVTLLSIYSKKRWVFWLSLIATIGANYLAYAALIIGPMGMSPDQLVQYNSSIFIRIATLCVFLTVPFVLISVFSFFFRKETLKQTWYTALRVIALIPSVFGILDLLF